MRHIALLVALVTPTLAHADNLDPMLQTMREDAQESATIIYNAVSKSAPENFIVSPYAVQTAIGMLYAGASGVTAEQIASALHWRLPPASLPTAHLRLQAQMQALIHADGVQWENAGHVWLKQGTQLRDAYRETLEKDFGAGADTIAFNPDAVQKLNDWVSAKTQGMLHDLVTPDMLTPPPALVELVATYFKAAWETPCKAGGQRAFFSHGNVSKEVAVVRCETKFKPIQLADTAAYTAVEMPYVHDTLRMLIIMPKTDLTAFERKLRASTLSDVLQAMHEERAEVTFPSFEITTPFPLKKSLQDLNVRDLFTDRANLSGIAKTPLRVDAMLEQARIKVDEHGTEAAAAVATRMMPLAAHLPPDRKVVIDHPFMFVIHNRTAGVPLFMGRVTAL